MKLFSSFSRSSHLQSPAAGTKTYYGVSDRTNVASPNAQNESRWSKLREDQAAKLFEKRYFGKKNNQISYPSIERTIFLKV